MKKIRIIAIALLVFALLPLCSRADSDADSLFSRILQQYSAFLAAETTQEIPIHDAATDAVAEVFYCSSEPDTKTVLNDSVSGKYEDRSSFRYNSYDAGERVIGYLHYMYVLSNAMENASKPCPVNTQSMKALYDQHGDSCTIVCMDSAYLHGTRQSGDGRTAQWEAIPFTLLDTEETDYEDAAYIYFQMVIDEGEDCDNVIQYVIADQATVCSLFEYMLSLNADIDAGDRNKMLAYIERRSLPEEEEAAQTFDLIQRAYEQFTASVLTEPLFLSGSGMEMTYYIAPLRNSDAGFHDAACEHMVERENMGAWSMDACSDSLMDMTHFILSISVGLQDSKFSQRLMSNENCLLALVYGLNLTIYNRMYVLCEDAQTGVRWEMLPFSLRITGGSNTDYWLSRPNLYVRIAQPQEDGTALIKEWIIEDEATFSELMPGFLPDIMDEIGDHLRRQAAPEGSGAAA